MNSKTVQFRLTLVILLIILFFIFLFITVYFFVFKETSKNYSLIQSWKEYHGVEDWNLAKHAIVDMDGDNKKDMVTFTNCAFLSSVAVKKIPSEKQCKEPGMSTFAFRDNSVIVGQKLIPQKPFWYQFLRKSYLVKTHNDIWKFYDMNGFQLRTYELGKDSLF